MTGDHQNRVTDYTAICCQNTGVGWWNEGDIAQTLRTPCGGDSTKANLVVCDVSENQSMQVLFDKQALGKYGNGNVASSIKQRDYKEATDLVVDVRVYPGVGITSKQNASNPQIGDPSPTLSTDNRNYLVSDAGNNAQHDADIYPSITGPLMANSHPGSYTGQDAFNNMLPVVPSDKPPRRYIVRRLTPLECCRLQGFPDWWIDGCSEERPVDIEFVRTGALDYIDPNCKIEGSDSAQYKLWGNGMALPNMLHVMRGIANQENKQ